MPIFVRLITMKKFLSILFLLAFMVSCEKEDLLLSERDKIEKYLTSSRNMVVESEVGNVIQDNPPFYNVFDRYAYRHIVNYDDEGRNEKPVVEWGDKIEIRFNAYTFTGSEPSQSAIYWSNIPEVITALSQKTEGTLDWPTEPLTIELGKTEMLEGLEYTLPGCHEADSVQVYMTSNLAYGKNLVGVVGKNSMIAWYMKIEKVTK